MSSGRLALANASSIEMKLRLRRSEAPFCTAAFTISIISTVFYPLGMNSRIVSIDFVAIDQAFSHQIEKRARCTDHAFAGADFDGRIYFMGFARSN